MKNLFVLVLAGAALTCVNLGDQTSDLVGGHAEQGFQMPNPFYYIR